jgi:site-specific DNA recombinase
VTATAPPRQVRVAIYTRKSVTDGLDQAFNSLDAQRQAIENYVASQVGLGWIAIPKRYDDGGFSGATTDRPAFLQLLRDVESGHVDVIAVYRTDRISRSVSDFTRFMEVLERRSVGFVSITQSFDTRTSMGRLTLNILASFSQFERETIAERIRDKVRETRRRGLYTGGKVVLGYDVVDKKLVVNNDEATQVRATFALYLERGSLRETVAELNRRGWRNKTLKTKAARKTDGGVFTNNSLHGLLRNTLYSGRVRCGTELVQGVHEAIIDAETWQAVQERLRSNSRNGGATARNKSGALLRGLLRCARCGSPMLHTFTTRDGRRHQYYVCMRLHNEGANSCPGCRVPAGKFETFVADRIRAIGTDESLLTETAESLASAAAERAEQLDGELRRGELERRRLEADRSGLLRAAPPTAEAAAPLLAEAAGIDDQLRALEQRQAEVRAERQALAGKTMHADLRGALAGFAPVWEHLFPRERERILRLLIERITYDPDTANADIELRACGITTLAGEARGSA